MDKIEWLESHGIENMRMRYESANLMSVLVRYLITMSLTGAGAALFQLAGNFEYFQASLFCAIWLSTIAVYLAVYCLGMRDFPPIYNNPSNLNQPDYDFEQLRYFQLEHLGNCCVQAANLNAQRAKQINYAIVALSLTPLIAIIIALSF